MLDIFDILGPIMIGPSSSHTAGAVRIGGMARALLGSQPVQAQIGLYGSFAQTGKGHGTDRALVAGLLGMKPDDLRIPRSFELADAAGLRFRIHPVSLRDAHPNSALLTVTAADGRTLSMQASSVGGGRIRVNQLDGIPVDFSGEYTTILVRHMDVPGELATLTRALSDANINIANMTLARSKRGSYVMTIIEIDNTAPMAIIERLRQVPYVEHVTYYEREEN